VLRQTKQLISGAPDEEEGSCSTKRVSVLDAEGGPQARESTQGDSSQSLRARNPLFIGHMVRIDASALGSR
jgi:hypothetical protein